MNIIIAQGSGAKTLQMPWDVRVRIRHLPFWPLWTAALTCEMACKPLRVTPPIFRRRVDWFRQVRAFSIDKAKTELGYHPKVDSTNRPGEVCPMRYVRASGTCDVGCTADCREIIFRITTRICGQVSRIPATCSNGWRTQRSAERSLSESYVRN